MEKSTGITLTRDLTPAGAWAFSLGTSIGWGSLMVTSRTYLSQAGPAGSILGLLAGAVIMLIIARNYAYMMARYPSAGGTYTFAKETFGCDYGFLAAWFAALVYFAMLWANATALPLFFHYFLGDLFRTGRMYTLFGYEVYLGETVLAAAAVLLIAILCILCKGVLARLMTGMGLLLACGIAVCFLGAFLGHGQDTAPAFVPDAGALSQVITIACISPWAFIGFEAICHSGEELSFRQSRAFPVLAVSILSATALYIFVLLLSISAYPRRYSSWLEYIRASGELKGLEGLPAFYAAHHYLGSAGVAILMLTLLCLIFTSLIGNISALSRLFLVLGKDGILPGKFGALGSRRTPAGAILLVAAISMGAVFLGRTAIGWIVDVTTLGATFLYGIVSAATFRAAKEEGDRWSCWTGMLGVLFMAGFLLYLLVPNLFHGGSMARESYFLFVVWGVLGFIYFREILKRDEQRRFGNSIIVWISLLSLVLFVSLVWMSQSILDATSTGMNRILESYREAGITEEQTGLLAEQVRLIRQTSARSIGVVILLFAISLGTLLGNYRLISARARESERQLELTRQLANRDPLTGVKSKHAWVEFEMELDERISEGEAENFALVVCDVNGLKAVNDTLGHKAGDDYIRSASAMICEIFKHSPVYRIGGDEFVVYLEGHDYEARRRLLQEVHETSVAHIASGRVVVSAGLSDYVEQDNLVHDVFQRADALMYSEKKALKALGACTRE